MTTTEATGQPGAPLPQVRNHVTTAWLIVTKMRSGRRPEALRIPTTIRYEAADPWAITLVFGRIPGGWTFSRSLLDHGRYEPSGEGLVRVKPILGKWVEITFRPVDLPPVLLSFEREEIDAALAFSEELIPLGAEGKTYDLDAELARHLTTGGGAR